VRNRFTKLSLAGLLILTAGQIPAQNAGTHTAEVQAIKENEARWSREFEMRDLEKIVAHYADDAIMMAPGLPAASGKDTILSALREMLADNAFLLRFHTSRVEIAESGDLASSQGSYTVTMTDPRTGKAVTSSGSYVTVYRKEAGGWKAVSDIASPGPAAAAQTSTDQGEK
jgi:ketosteroid isomerase-like protein